MNAAATADLHGSALFADRGREPAPRRKILFLSGVRIFPCNTGGHVRSGGIARALAHHGHEVLIYSLAGRAEDYRPRDLLRRDFRRDEIETHVTEETHLGLGLGVLQAAGRRLDYPRVWQHALLARGMIPGRLKRALRAADTVLCDLPWCPPVPGPWAEKPFILVSHNLEHRLLEQGPPRHRRFARWMREVERSAPGRYRDILTCAEEDRDFFRAEDPGGRLALPLVRCGVDPSAYVVPAGTRERIRAELGLTDADRVLTFSASGFGPNLEALEVLREFCRTEAAFLVRERLHVLVLGSVVREAYRDGAMIATGRVPEIAPYFAASDAGLNAVTRGSGANVKLFEYLAARLPVISTHFGVRGTGLVPDVDFLPYEPAELKPALERFLREGSREAWKSHAEAVWSRHRSSCDIDELIRGAIAQLPALAP